MYHYVQFRPNKKESWKIYSKADLDRGVDKRPAFQTVLAVSHDVDTVLDAGEEPLDTLSYLGPMYFDLDNEDDIDDVLDSTRELIHKIEDMFGIEPKYLQCWLSGGKGVHIVVPSELFGVNRARKHLPMIYRELAAMVEVDNLDMGVYSCGKGRMWRCAGVKRPDKGTYKVPVTVEELEDMDAETYQTLVSQPRDELAITLPPSNLKIAKAESACRVASKAALRKVKALKQASTVPAEEARKIDEVPGCIEKLITDGDSPESNWNQAAMQLASWIALRFDKEEHETYQEKLVEPFVHNVESSSRPTVKDRRQHMKDQLNRAFSGRTKFSIGPLIATIGQPCNNCPLCRTDFMKNVTQGSETGPEDPQITADGWYDPINKIRKQSDGYYMVGDRLRKLTSFTFTPEVMVYEIADTEDGGVKDGRRECVRGVVTVDGSDSEVELEEEAWHSRAKLTAALSGISEVGVTVECNDIEVAKIYQSIMRIHLKSETEPVTQQTRITRCGIILEKTSRGQYLTHYVERGSSKMTMGDGELSESRFVYAGRAEHSPQLFACEYPLRDDKELKETLLNLFRINDTEKVAKVVGWLAACHLREHIHEVMPQFPLLNLWGNASAGKTMTAFLAGQLCGMDWQAQHSPVNLEGSTIHSAREATTRATTVPVLFEEANEATMTRGGRNSPYEGLMGILKAAWNKSTVQSGSPTGIKTLRINSPILYISEQRAKRPAVQNRTVEVMLTASGRERAGRSEAFRKAWISRHSLTRAAKAMMHNALFTSVAEVGELIEAQSKHVPDFLDERPRWSMMVILAGLDFLADSLMKCNLDIRSDVKLLKDAVIADLAGNAQKMDLEKRVSEVDRVLNDMDQMALEPEQNYGLKSGTHYERVGNWLKIDIRRSLPKYKAYCRFNGEKAYITDYTQMGQLLSGESYFDRMQPREDNPKDEFHVLSLSELEAKGLILTGFRETL